MPKVGMKPLRRNQLINATLDSIYENGFADTTVATISKKAGVSSGIIAHYFGSKGDLLEASMRELLKTLGDDIINRQQHADTPIEKIHAIIDGNFDPKQTTPRACQTWLVFWTQALHQPELARLQRVNRIRLRSNLRYWIGQLLSERQQVINVADGLAALIDGLWLRGAFEKNGIDPNRSIQICRNYVDQRLLTQTP